MPVLPVLKPEDVVRALEKMGYILHRQKGSHLILVHPERTRFQPVIPMHNQELKCGTLRAIIRQAGLTVQEFIDLL